MGAAARVFGVARLISAVLALFFCFSLAVLAAETFDKQPLAIVTKDGKSHAFTVELAVTPRQREQGLMNRREMAEDHGMLFAFGETRQVFMWMKNTYLPLDMVFFGKDGRVVSIARDTEPLSERIISSGEPATTVVEFNAGTAAKLGIEKGDRLIFPVPKQ